MKKTFLYTSVGVIVVAIIVIIGLKNDFLNLERVDSTVTVTHEPETHTHPDTQNLEEDDSTSEESNDTEEDDCIFDQQTQTDEFLQGISALEGYSWDQEAKTAHFRLENGDTLLISRGGCYSFGVSAEFRLRNDTTDYSDWQNVYGKVLWIAKVLDKEFEHDRIKQEIDSSLVTIEEMDQGASVYFSDEYLQDNNYSIERDLQKELTILRLGYYIN